MQPVELLSEAEEEGFIDLTFSIVRSTDGSGGSRLIDVRATFQDTILGLAIDLTPGWKPCKVADLPSYKGIVAYRSPGEVGDRFLEVLSRLYGESDAPRQMNGCVRFTAITLGDNPLDDSGPVNIKLFYEHDDEARYAELYTNVDLSRGIVQIREKDEGYRAAIIRALTKLES